MNLQNNGKEKDGKKGLIVFIGICIAAVLVFIFNNASNSSESRKIPSSSKTGNVKFEFNSESPYIAKLYIKGEIAEMSPYYNQQWILSTIEALALDENNRAVILFIDSPGGTVYESDETYFALRQYRETGKKVYAYFTHMACSGAYYISCAADYIMANRNTLTGSIGVISGQFFDISGFMDEHGVKSTTIHSGKNKTMGDITQPLSMEQQDIMQAISDECYQQFTDIVCESRNLTKEELYPIADGRVYTAKQALENKLIDSIGSFEDLVDYVFEDSLISYYCEVIPFEYKPEIDFLGYMMHLSSLLEKSKSLTENSNQSSPMLYYKY